MIRCLRCSAAVLLLTATLDARAVETRDSPPPDLPAPGVEASVGDRVVGASLAERCTACHTLDRGGERKWGPNLFGIVDRPVGADAAYRYGPYLRAQSAAAATWSEASLRGWLVDSKAIARAADARTKMPAQGLTDEQLDDLISYLRTLK